jgi:hypothetical protein
MAVIMITDDLSWFASAACLAFVTEKLDASGNFPDYHQHFLDVEAGWQALDIRRMNPEQRLEVSAVVSDTTARVRANGPAKHGGEVPFNGLLARLTDLYDLLGSKG